MSLDRSLKSASSLVRHRNVLTRTERLEKLKEEEKWTEAKSVFGLPKVAHRKMELIKGGGKEEAEGAEAAVAGATPGAAPAAAAAAGKGAAAPAAGAKGAAPAAGAKAAAPAAAGGKAAAAPAAKKK